MNDFTNLNKNECLVLIGRNKIFNKIIRQYVSDNLGIESYMTISEYPIADNFININKYKIYHVNKQEWDIIHDTIDLTEVIYRDRLLRNIELSNAKELIIRVSKWFIEYFRSNNIKLLCIHVIDNYVKDIMVSIARSYGCIVCGNAAFFVEGYRRVTINGEYTNVRSVDDDEVFQFRTKIEDSYKSKMVPSKVTAIKRSLLYFFKYKIKYLVFYIIFYKLLGKLEYDYISTPYGSKVNKIINLFPHRYFSSIDICDINDNSIYVPLHYSPESTVDYWSDSICFSDYVTSVYESVSRLVGDGYTVYIKEHPGMCYRRDVSFYKNLLNIGNGNVTLLDPFTDGNHTIKMFKNILVWTGSTGIEALILKKHVFFVSSNYYFTKDPGVYFDVCYMDGDREVNEFVRNVLSSTFRFSLK